MRELRAWHRPFQAAACPLPSRPDAIRWSDSVRIKEIPGRLRILHKRQPALSLHHRTIIPRFSLRAPIGTSGSNTSFVTASVGRSTLTEHLRVLGESRKLTDQAQTV